MFLYVLVAKDPGSGLAPSLLNLTQPGVEFQYGGCRRIENREDPWDEVENGAGVGKNVCTILNRNGESAILGRLIPSYSGLTNPIWRFR